MLKVKTPSEVFEIIEENFKSLEKIETVSLLDSLGRILAEDIISNELIPSFNRSTVDGFAVFSKDCFGCSESIPAILPISEEIEMGKMPKEKLAKGSCAKVPTGGAVPDGADAVVMLEYTEDYADGTIGIFKSPAPGANLIYKGDDAKPGDILLKQGYKITAQDIGSLAALGIREVKVSKEPLVGIISTGNELVDSTCTPKPGEVRNVNSDLLSALILESGAKYINYGIIKDEEALVDSAIKKALKECDMVLISGGSSAGDKDYAVKVIEKNSKLLFHGIAIKPGKPTILGNAKGKAIFGLPGHPVASYFVCKIFVTAVLRKIMGKKTKLRPIKAILTESIESNHGRAQYGGVYLSEKNGKTFATPVHSKSGLITTLAQTDGFYQIDSECEGIGQGNEIEVFINES